MATHHIEEAFPYAGSINLTMDEYRWNTDAKMIG
jgi:hypothetical protein